MKKTIVSFALALMLIATVGCGFNITGGQTDPEETTQEMVIVPDIEGLYPDEAESMLQEAGLKGNEISHHGPTDGAGDIGEAYNQSPKAGAEVENGSTVTYHTWWEAG